ncbi:MAG TPA: SDR family oxidoreductase [Thermodesulfobacteriota bacterium]|nr:SDR family oxidoreductase [Thermodesulfobacteriota bacterium]
MAILVTGATGFLGSHVARKLVERGERVRILLRKTSRTSNIKDIDAERAYGDILDIDSVKEALKGCDTLYHIAGIVSSRKSDYGRMEEINVKGTFNVFSSALEAGVKKAVYTSSVAAIGVDPNGGIANEETPFTLEPMGIQYLNTKYYAEKEALKFYQKGLPLVIVNPSIVIGPGDIYLSSTALIVWYCKRKFPGYMDGGVNVVDVEDVAEGHILAAEKGRVGERYILGNKNLSIMECFSLLERVTGIPSPKRKVPYFVALTAGFIRERIIRVSSPSFVLQDVDSAKAGRLYWYFDSSKAVRELGFPQTPVEESLKKTIKWFRDNGYLDN